MVIGAAAFGILGAMVGGRVKTKQASKLNSLLLFEYLSNDVSKQILLNLGDNQFQANTFLKKLKKIKPLSNQTIEL